MADIAEVLRALPPDDAMAVTCTLPFDVAVKVLDEPELEGHRRAITEQLPREIAARLIKAMSADQQADLFRELPDDRQRFLKLLDYRPANAEASSSTRRHGRRNHDDGIRGRSRRLDRGPRAGIHQRGRAQGDLYAVYVIDPANPAFGARGVAPRAAQADPQSRS